jgi:diguanylate cyclase (GGDEF)-like protein
MTATSHTALIIAPGDTVKAVKIALAETPELVIIHTDTTADAMKHIFSRSLAFIVMDLTMPEIDPHALADSLLRFDHAKIPPVLLVTDAPGLPDLYDKVPPLLLDHVTKPIEPVLIRARLFLFLALFRHRIAVDQSIQELEKVYTRFMDQHQSALSETTLKKNILSLSSAFTNQVQPFLSKIQASSYFLQQAPDMPLRLRQGVTRIRTAGDHIAEVIRRLHRSQNRELGSQVIFQDKTGKNRSGRILFATHFTDEFMIFERYLAGRIKADLIQAGTSEQALEYVASSRPDVIFINHQLADGSGLHLLDKLIRLRTGAPIIYTVDQHNTDAGAAAIATGAYTFLVKEQTSATDVVDTIQKTLTQARLTQKVQGARDRIDLISRRDQLTRLLNRSWFNQTLALEISKARRYCLPLSILLVQVDRFMSFNEKYGYKTGDLILTACAARIQTMVRDLDVVCRFGAEKFGIVLPNTRFTRAQILAERIRQNINDNKIFVGNHLIQLTISIGMACFTGEQQDTENRASAAPGPGSVSGPDLVHQALKALDIAIHQGGNQIQA